MTPIPYVLKHTLPHKTAKSCLTTVHFELLVQYAQQILRQYQYWLFLPNKQLHVDNPRVASMKVKGNKIYTETKHSLQISD